uniref:nucleosome assembly protein 1;2-like isoform X2 n=1 Tax=Erigeron canadensis TaxID=72917 RepID=UPI001CB91748|nr:nucleosome assembly protein 1;2-like isoform X2 [Erigeron canadensis]XP_043626928.1 nucleosome assembly protein 1;2-like isoform X2 [Erigeron canadensis]
MSTDDKRIANKVEEEKKKKFDPRRELIKVSSADFKNLSYQDKRYWAHAHFMFMANSVSFKAIDDPDSDSEEGEDDDDDEEEEEEEKIEEEESKVPKKNDDEGSGPRGASWKKNK